ncbi:MAG TPA: hypothetical protein VMZ53_15145 [Kofleriaceae bacterium]|nr:hypothetical protein [Kofleriaceae bacterium]
MVPSLLLATLCFACGNDERPLPPPPEVRPPVRGAVGDTDLRVMLAEIASSKACEIIKDSFRALKGTQDPNTMTGLLWIRECKITNAGTKVTYELAGQGWQWAEQTKKKAGGTFELSEYVKFGVKAHIEGSIDIAYDTKNHIASIWYSPTEKPSVTFEPIGDVDVEEKGAWSEVVGGLSTLVGSSPDRQGEKQAKKQGTNEFERQLGEGMTVAVDLCTGYQRFTLGRPDKGDLGPPNVGESFTQPVELAKNGMIVFGPYFAQNGMHVKLNSDGPVRAGLACADDVHAAADAFVHEQPLPQIATLAQADITGTGTLKIKPQRCKVVLVAKSLSENKVRFDWARPPQEIAQSTGGPAVHCARKGTLSSASNAAGSGASPSTAARRR